MKEEIKTQFGCKFRCNNTKCLIQQCRVVSLLTKYRLSRYKLLHYNQGQNILVSDGNDCSVKQALVLWQISPDCVLWTNPDIKVFPNAIFTLLFFRHQSGLILWILTTSHPRNETMTHIAVRKQNKTKRYLLPGFFPGLVYVCPPSRLGASASARRWCPDCSLSREKSGILMVFGPKTTLLNDTEKRKTARL